MHCIVFIKQSECSPSIQTNKEENIWGTRTEKSEEKEHNEKLLGVSGSVPPFYVWQNDPPCSLGMSWLGPRHNAKNKLYSGQPPNMCIVALCLETTGIWSIHQTASKSSLMYAHTLARARIHTLKQYYDQIHCWSDQFFSGIRLMLWLLKCISSRLAICTILFPGLVKGD